jgi:hypothetical protein
MNGRKLKLVRITPEALMEVLRKGSRCRLVTEGLPPDADFRGCSFDFETQTFVIAVWSDSYEPVPVGEVIPRQDIIVMIPAPCTAAEECDTGVEQRRKGES